MDLLGVPAGALRVFCEVAERQTLTAAAAALGYTQSAVSRQIAVIERAVEAPVLERRRDGVRLTAAGRIVLRHATAVLDRISATERELVGLPAAAGTVRLGWIPSAGVFLVPRALAALSRTHPAIAVSSREGTTRTLVRALRAGNVDLAVVGARAPFRPFDTETPALLVEILAERPLCVAVPASHPLADRDDVDVDELRGQRWISGPASDGDPVMGVWPGLDERPTIAHTARDWLSKLHFVAAGAGITTAPLSVGPAAPDGVRFIGVRAESRELHRLHLVQLPDHSTPASRSLADAIRVAV